MILGEGRRPLYGLLAFGLAGAMGFLLGGADGDFIGEIGGERWIRKRH